MPRQECTLRIKGELILLTTKSKRLKYDDPVWAFNGHAYARDDDHQFNLEPYYQIGRVQDVWTDLNKNVSQQLVNIKYGEGEVVENNKIEAVELVLFQGAMLERMLRPKDIQTIMANNGTCYVDFNDMPKKIYFTPEEIGHPEEHAVMEKYELEEKSDEAVHAQYDPVYNAETNEWS